MRRAGAVLGVMLAAGCGDRPPSIFIGQWAHFRLHVDPALLPVPPPFDGDNALAALETEWSDVKTMLHMPEGVIDYYWYTQANTELACGSPDEGACTKESLLEIDSPTLPNPHELNHAYLYLRQQRKPIPLLAEGAAESIACGAMGSPLGDNVPWPDLVVAVPAPEEAYQQGGLLVRYLIRTQGIDAFLRYYEQSPERRDPAVFAANFQSFWGMSLDDVWGAMHVQAPGAPYADSKICPCSLPPLPAGATPSADLARFPYWVVPAEETMGLAPSSVFGHAGIGDCSGSATFVSGQVVLARLDSSAPWYVMAPANVTTGPYLADDCASTIPYPLPTNLVTEGFALLAMAVSPPASGETVYFQLGVPFSGLIDVPQEVELCASCAFDQGSCQPGTAVVTRQPFPGSVVYGRWTIAAGARRLATESFDLWSPTL